MIQVRNKGEQDLGIEDATQHWDESVFAFIPVASITISAPQLDIDKPENSKACENLEFNPWHSLQAHQPLGGINRLRRKVYKTSAKHRK